jgi:hypothetical protein
MIDRGYKPPPTRQAAMLGDQPRQSLLQCVPPASR